MAQLERHPRSSEYFRSPQSPNSPTFEQLLQVDGSTLSSNSPDRCYEQEDHNKKSSVLMKVREKAKQLKYSLSGKKKHGMDIHDGHGMENIHDEHGMENIHRERSGRGMYVNDQYERCGMDIHDEHEGRGRYINDQHTGRGKDIHDEHEGCGMCIHDQHKGREMDVHDHEGRGMCIHDQHKGRGMDIHDQHEGRGLYIDDQHKGRGNDIYDEHQGRGMCIHDQHKRREMDIHDQHEERGMCIHDQHKGSGMDIDDQHKGRGMDIHGGHKGRRMDSHDGHEGRGMDIHAGHKGRGTDVQDGHEGRGMDMHDEYEECGMDMHDEHEEDGMQILDTISSWRRGKLEDEQHGNKIHDYNTTSPWPKAKLEDEQHGKEIHDYDTTSSWRRAKLEDEQHENESDDYNTTSPCRIDDYNTTSPWKIHAYNTTSPTWRATFDYVDEEDDKDPEYLGAPMYESRLAPESLKEYSRQHPRADPVFHRSHTLSSCLKSEVKQGKEKNISSNKIWTKSVSDQSEPAYARVASPTQNIASKVADLTINTKNENGTKSPNAGTHVPSLATIGSGFSSRHLYDEGLKSLEKKKDTREVSFSNQEKRGKGEASPQSAGPGYEGLKDFGKKKEISELSSKSLPKWCKNGGLSSSVGSGHFSGRLNDDCLKSLDRKRETPDHSATKPLKWDKGEGTSTPSRLNDESLKTSSERKSQNKEHSPNNQQKLDRGVSVKEYFMHKLEPGEDEKALSQVISESLSPRKSPKQSSVVDKFREVVSSFMRPEEQSKPIINKADKLAPVNTKSVRKIQTRVNSSKNPVSLTKNHVYKRSNTTPIVQVPTSSSEVVEEQSHGRILQTN